MKNDNAPTAEPVAQVDAVAFKHPAAVRSAAAFLLERFEHAPCDDSGVACCIRCSAVAMSRWAIEALDSSLAAQPHAVPSINIAAVREVIPTSWLDPLLSGQDAVLDSPPYDGHDIERLLHALRDRLAAALPKETP